MHQFILHFFIQVVGVIHVMSQPFLPGTGVTTLSQPFIPGTGL